MPIDHRKNGKAKRNPQKKGQGRPAVEHSVEPPPKGFRIHPMGQVLLGMAIAIGMLVVLFAADFHLIDLAWCLPVLAVAAWLVYGGAKRLKRK